MCRLTVPYLFCVTVPDIGLVSGDCPKPERVMAQFGGQKNPPWATQFAATAVSQPGHSGQSLDLSSLHCEYRPIHIDWISSSLNRFSVTQPCLTPVFPPPQLSACSSRLSWEPLPLFTRSSRPWLQSLSATSRPPTISCHSKRRRCSSRRRQLPRPLYSRSVHGSPARSAIRVSAWVKLI